MRHGHLGFCLVPLLLAACSTPPGPVDSGWRRYDTVTLDTVNGVEQARVTIKLAPGETIVAINNGLGRVDRLEVRAGGKFLRQYAGYVPGVSSDAVPVVAWSGDGSVWTTPADVGLQPWSL